VIEACIQGIKAAINTLKHRLEDIEDVEFPRMERRIDQEQAVVKSVDAMADQLAKTRRMITKLEETHDALNEKFKKLMDEEDEEEKVRLLDGMKDIMEAARKGLLDKTFLEHP
jgi:RNA processing factor Prp31